MARSKREHEPDKDSAGDQQENPNHESPPVSASTVVDETDTPVGEDRTDDTNNDKRPYWRRSVNWDRWFAGVLVVCAVVQASVGWFQWDAMREQTGISQDALARTDKTLEIMRIGQRAWIAIDVPHELEFTAGKPIFTRIRVTNYGQTPAIITGTKTTVAILETADSISKYVKKPEDLIISRNTLCAPSQSLTFPEHHIVPSTGEVAAIKKGTMKLWIVMSIVYDDAFGKAQTHQQCMFYDTATGGVSFAPDCQ